MKILVTISLFCAFLLTSCESDTDVFNPLASPTFARFRLTAEDYDDVELTRGTESPPSTRRFDEISYYVVDEADDFVNVKTLWRPETSELIIEGLQRGQYRLLLLAVQGDAKADRATIHPLTTSEDVWLSFPKDQTDPLQADYFHAQIAFDVEIREGAEAITNLQEVRLKRLNSGIEFNFAYNNPYVRTAVESNTLLLEDTKFCTEITALGQRRGESLGGVRKVEFGQASRHILRFMPSISGSEPLNGKIEMRSRNYRGKKIVRNYNLSIPVLQPQRLHRANTQVEHPDDTNGVLYMTPGAFKDSRHAFILQNNEPKEVYSDGNQRKFTTTTPLQTEVTRDGELHLRFYSPRPLKDVTIRTRISSANEPITLAYLDSLPAFADVWLEIPATKRSMTFPTASGSYVTLPPLTVDELSSGEFHIESGDEYWERLQKIKVAWTINFGLFGGNPDRPDGGPTGGWLGIRPVYCREAVSFMLNVTYMFGLEEVVEVMRARADELLGNDGVTPEPIDRLVSNMRATRSFTVGLVDPGVYLGLGSPSVWGVVPDCFLKHYDNAYTVHTNFHELGHVMNYNHDSKMTYGIWSESLMNNFYVNNISQFPIDKYTYLNSRTDPSRYYAN